VAIVENKTRPGISTANGTVTLDLGTIVTNLAQQLGLPQAVISKIPEETGTITVLKSNQLSLAQTAVRSIRVLSVWLVVLTLFLWGLALYLARGARRATRPRAGTRGSRLLVSAPSWRFGVHRCPRPDR
jgi:hypothetical protein